MLLFYSLKFNKKLVREQNIQNVVIILLLLFLLHSIPFIGTSYSFILFSLIPVLYFIYALNKEDKPFIKIILPDIGWIIFIGVGFLSYFWAVNGSLVWYYAFSWLTLFLWMLLFRTLFFQKNFGIYFFKTFLFLFVINLLLHVYAIYSNALFNSNWVIIFGNNWNYTSVYLVSLYPFLLFYESKHFFFKCFKIIATCLLFWILSETSARGAIIALISIYFYFAWANRSRTYFWRIIGGLSVFSICIAGIIYNNNDYFNFIPLYNEFKKPGEWTRFYIILNSLYIFLDNPLGGIGLGNLHLEVYKYGVGSVEGLNNVIKFNREGSHNLYSKLLAELGLIGAIAFLFPISRIVWQGWSRSNELNNNQKAIFANILVYLIGSFFYKDLNSYSYFFCGIQLLAFCSIGIFTSFDTTSNYYSLKKGSMNLLLVPSLACLMWFIYANKTNYIYLRAQNMISRESEEAIQCLKTIYSPIFKTTNGREDKLIAFELAKLHQTQQKYSVAEDYYQIALKHAPYNEELLMSYANYLLKIRQNPEKAKACALRVYAIQNNYYPVIMLLAEIAIEELDYKQALYYLNTHTYSINFDAIKNQINLIAQRIEQEIFKKAPYSEELLMSYAKFSFKIRNPAKAKIYALRFDSLQNNNLEVKLLLAKIAINQEEYSQADFYFQSALIFASNNKELLKEYSFFLLLVRKLAKARKYALQLDSLSNSSGETQLILAEISFFAKDYEKVRYYLENVRKSSRAYQKQIRYWESLMEEVDR